MDNDNTLLGLLGAGMVFSGFMAWRSWKAEQAKKEALEPMPRKQRWELLIVGSLGFVAGVTLMFWSPVPPTPSNATVEQANLLGQARMALALAKPIFGGLGASFVLYALFPKIMGKIPEPFIGHKTV